MSHLCNEECQKQFNFGYNCALGCTNWDKPNPPWQESGFFGGGIGPDEDDLERIRCHSARYREGWKKAKWNKYKVCTPEEAAAFGFQAQEWTKNHPLSGSFWQMESRLAVAEYIANQQGFTRYTQS